MINFIPLSLSLLLQLAFPTEIRLATASPVFPHGCPFVHIGYFKIYFLIITLSSEIQLSSLKGIKSLTNHSIVYFTLYSSTTSFSSFLSITRVQNCCSQLISNSDSIPCLSFSLYHLHCLNL